MRNGTSQSPFRTRSSTDHCAPAVPVTGTTSQHRFARCDSVASSRDDSTPRSDARFVSPLALTHVGYTVSPRGLRGLTASAFSLPCRSAIDGTRMSFSGREPPVSGFLFGISLIVRLWSETHRSSREQRHSLALWHTVKFGHLRTFRTE